MVVSRRCVRPRRALRGGRDGTGSGRGGIRRIQRAPADDLREPRQPGAAQVWQRPIRPRRRSCARRCRWDRRPGIIRDDAGEVGFTAFPYSSRTPSGRNWARDGPMRRFCGGRRPHQGGRFGAGLDRTVVAAHAFITGGEITDSNGTSRWAAWRCPGWHVRWGVLRCSGPPPSTADGSPAEQFHSARLQRVTLGFSFSERDHTKSVALVELDAGEPHMLSASPRPCPGRCGRCRGASGTHRQSRFGSG